MTEGSSGGWWTISFAAVLPAMALAVAGGAAGLSTTTGLLFVGGAGAYFLVDLLVLQPLLDRKLLGDEKSLTSRARTFLQRALAARTVADVYVELEATVSGALGTDKILLIVPSLERGGVHVFGAREGEEARLGDAEKAFLWLGERAEPVDRDLLSQVLEFDGARATFELLERLGGHVVLPLRHRGLLLGLVVLGKPARAVAPSQLHTFCRALGAHVTMAVANTHLKLEAGARKQLARAIDLATAVQEALLPDDRPIRRGAFSLRGVYRPVAECGGDLWTYQDLGHGRLLLVIGDATGHGAAPAMLTAVAKGAIDAVRHVAGAEIDPAELLVQLNRAVYAAGRTRYLMTAFAVVVDAERGELRFANAGQNFPYVLGRGEGGRVRLEALVARGNTLGAMPEARYATSTRRFGPGERLVLFTDGVVDAGAPLVEPFGEKRFRAVLQAQVDTPAARLPEIVLAEVEAYLGGRATADDITVVAAEIVPPEEPERGSPP